MFSKVYTGKGRQKVKKENAKKLFTYSCTRGTATHSLLLVEICWKSQNCVGHTLYLMKHTHDFIVFTKF